MGVDVAHLLGGDARVLQGPGHGQGGALSLGVGLGDVVGVGAPAEAHELGVDAGAPLLRVLVRLQDQDPGPLPHDEPVPGEGEGAARLLGLLVPCGKGSHHSEGPDGHGGDGGLRPPARTRSASPSWIMRRALPRASAPVAQAVTTVEEGPVKP